MNIAVIVNYRNENETISFIKNELLKKDEIQYIIIVNNLSNQDSN